MTMIDWLRHIIETQDGKILYILSIISILMIIDFTTGTWAAYRNTDIKFESKKGIDGILRKVASLVMLILAIPLMVLVPMDTGIIALQALYIGYLGFELKSVFENLEKMGVNIEPLKNFVKKILPTKAGELDE